MFKTPIAHRLSNEIKQFIDETPWTWAKTYADSWPHHYIVKDKVDESLFQKFVLHIREFGEWELFYNTPLKYYEEDGMVYWTMVPKDTDPKCYPPETEDIINKCPVDSTYKVRLQEGTLPD
jgi:hypothetical protein